MRLGPIVPFAASLVLVACASIIGFPDVPDAEDAGSSGSSSGSMSSNGASSGGSTSGGRSGAASDSGGSSGGSTSGGRSGAASDSGGSSGADGGVAQDGGLGVAQDGGLGVAQDGGPAPYPGGPYYAAAGSNGAMATGCVIPNLSWMGYVDDAADALATTKPYVSYSLLDAYNDAKVSGKKYLMINIAEFDSPGSQSSATEIGMTTGGGASVDQAGGVLIEVLMTSGFVSPPTMANLDSWIQKYNLFVTTMADLDPSLPTNNTLGRQDQAYIIDLTTMKVLQYIDGSTTAAGSGNSGAEGIAAMHQLLGG